MYISSLEENMKKMENISCKEVRDHMADVINQVAYKSKKFTLTRHGSAVAVLVSLEEWNALEKLLEQKEDKEDIRDADRALKKHAKKRGVSLKTMKKKLGI
jgi:prevent-host-death family protein